MDIKKIMNKKPIVLKKSDTIGTAMKTFSKNKISGCPVIERQKVVGMLTRADVLKMIDVHESIQNADSKAFDLVLSYIRDGADVEDATGALDQIWKTRISTHMNKKVVTITPDDDIYKAARLMNENSINRLPVTQNSKLVGIVTRADIVNFLSKV